MLEGTSPVSSPLCFNSLSLKDAWIKLIRRIEPFQWFCTFTFREEVHPEQADRRYKRFIHQVNEYYFGKRYREKGLGCYHVRALEMQKRGVIHFHSLIGGAIKPEHRFYFMEFWNRDNGFARIFPYISARAPAYVRKYVSKGGQIDIFLSPWKKREVLFGSDPELNKVSSPVRREICYNDFISELELLQE